jgi:predicted 3-demethylubiquinone-9 3-methyltransferase (glyoxalase superfamily)
MQKITPFLWFHSNAEETINFYMSVFPNGKILSRNYFPEGHPNGIPGELMSAEFEIF